MLWSSKVEAVVGLKETMRSIRHGDLDIGRDLAIGCCWGRRWCFAEMVVGKVDRIHRQRKNEHPYRSCILRYVGMHSRCIDPGSGQA